MSTPTRSPLATVVERFLPRLRYPHLFAILAGLFLIDLLVPDPIPLVDEILLALLTILVGTFKTRHDPTPPPKDVTPPEPSLPRDTGTGGTESDVPSE